MPPFYRSGLRQSEAVLAVNDYRNKNEQVTKTKIVLYTKKDILDYIEQVFEPFESCNKPSAGLKWGIGHYFMIYKRRLSFCVVPTLYREDQNGNPIKLIDRYGSKDDELDLYSPQQELAVFQVNDPLYPPADGEAFDKGDMWP